MTIIEALKAQAVHVSVIFQDKELFLDFNGVFFVRRIKGWHRETLYQGDSEQDAVEVMLNG